MPGFDTKSNIWKLYLSKFLRNLQFFGSVSVPFFLDWAQIDYTKIFILESFFMLSIFILEVPTGIVADKYGRKLSIVLGSLCSAVSMFIFGFVSNYWLYFPAEFIGALGFTFMSGADSALLYDSLKNIHQDQDAGIIFSRYETAGTLGILLGFPLGSLIAGSRIAPYPSTLPLTFTLTGIFSLFAVIVALTFKEPERNEKIKGFIREGIEGFTYIFRHAKLRAFAFNFTFISSTTMFMFWFYQSLAQIVGIDVKYNGFIGAGYNLFSALLLLNIKRIENLIGMKSTLFYSAFLPGLFFAGLFFIKNTYFVLTAIFMITGLKMMRTPVLTDFMNRQIESRNRATVLSGISMLGKLMIMILYPMVGWLADISLQYTFLFLGIITLIFSFLNRIGSEHLE